MEIASLRERNVEIPAERSQQRPSNHEAMLSQSPNFVRQAFDRISFLTYFKVTFAVATVVSVLCIIIYDYRLKMQEHSAAILEEIEQCARNYIINQCDPETRVPWLETLCNTWQACMKKDPFKGKLSAEIIAEIITSFLEGLSYKAMFCFMVFVVIFICIPVPISRSRH